MKKWDMSNLLEYKEVMTEKLNDFHFLLRWGNPLAYNTGINYNLIPFEIERIKNLLVVVDIEIMSRG